MDPSFKVKRNEIKIGTIFGKKVILDFSGRK